MEALGINLGLLIVQIIAFIIVLLTLNAWVYKPMLDMMETRKQKIAQGLEDARVAAEARSDAEKQAAKILADAQAEAGKIVREATDRAASAGKDVKAAAEVEAAKARTAAVAEAEAERNRILGDLRGQVAALAIAAAKAHNIPVEIVYCTAPVEVLQQRLRDRSAANNDIADATVELLAIQQASFEDFTAEELAIVKQA